MYTHWLYMIGPMLFCIVVSDVNDINNSISQRKWFHEKVFADNYKNSVGFLLLQKTS